MAEKVIKHASFWYVTAEGVHQTALRGDTVDIERPEDQARGERHGAFATKEDLAAGTPLAAYIASREAAAGPVPAAGDPADPEPDPDPAAGEEGAIGSDRPALSASKGDWVAYHVAQRPDDVDEDTAQAEAEGWTKAQLAERAGRQYGADGDPPSS
ncbi:hypothetical protein ABT336_00265 [Micromonospora sp. NPDC000207]|uniref:hypothetical protein n=1 Tax=Micromonospora sp. NPDC000207 TaxID=3154246 RepID=UPI00331966EE